MRPEEMWNRFTMKSGVQDTYQAWAFCGGGEIGDRLAELVLQGIKTATSSALIAFRTEKEPLSKAGDYSVILFDNGETACVIQTHTVTLVPFDQVSSRHAYLEGEGDRSLAYWRQVHEKFFTDCMQEAGLVFTPQMKVVCEEYEVVYR